MNSDQLDRESDIPLYKQIENIILEKINQGIYKPGESIPTERKMRKKFEVSRSTIRKAVQELVIKKHLYRVQGNGTFVFEKKDDIPKKKNNIGVIVRNCDRELTSKILTGIEKKLQSENYIMSFVSSHDDYIKEAKAIQKLRNQNVAGLIIMPSSDQKDNTSIFDLQTEDFPFVLVDRRLQNCPANCVMSDNVTGAYSATKFLLDLDHQKIAFIKDKYNKTSTVEDRIIGYKKALEEYDIKFNFDLMFSYEKKELSRKEIYDKLYSFIKETRVSAVVALHDNIALDIMKMCQENKIKIPEDLSLTGFDNQSFSSHLAVPLTTVAQYPKTIGLKAAELLIQQINEKSKNEDNKSFIKQIYTPTKLIVRDSCTTKD